MPSFTGLPAAPFDARFGTVSLLDTGGISNYEGVTVSFKHNINSGWGKGVLQANYTYSHTFDDVSNAGNPNVFFALTSITSAINPFNTRRELRTRRLRRPPLLQRKLRMGIARSSRFAGPWLGATRRRLASGRHRVRPQRSSLFRV